MTELQMGLIGLGAVAVVGVLVYNKWQEVRQRKLAESVLKDSPPDILLGLDPVVTNNGVEAGGQAQEIVAQKPVVPTASENLPAKEAAVKVDERVEPVLLSEPELNFSPGPQDSTATAQGASSESPVSTMQTVATAAFSSGTAGAREQSTSASQVERIAEAPVPFSPRVDFIAAIDTVEPVPVQRIVDASKEALAHMKKPVRWFGYDAASAEWQPISGQQDGEYRRIRAGLQLVNRQGAVSENDLVIFTTAMQDLADQLTGIVDLPSWQNALGSATDLDRFCASVDIQIGINVISQGQKFAGTKLRALAEAAGMTIEEDGSFVRRDDDGNVLYVLLNQEAWAFSAETMRTMNTHGVTFLLDVPCVAHGERVFNQMVDLARRFADVLHGVLVDDNRQLLAEAQFVRIRQEFITKPQAAMDAADLPAGGSLALRLFN
jgi:FtsZ-interacting cell division protein ZipA